MQSQISQEFHQHIYYGHLDCIKNKISLLTSLETETALLYSCQENTSNRAIKVILENCENALSNSILIRAFFAVATNGNFYKLKQFTQYSKLLELLYDHFSNVPSGELTKPYLILALVLTNKFVKENIQDIRMIDEDILTLFKVQVLHSNFKSL